MLFQSPTVERLVGELAKLPGIGKKTARRLAFHILRLPAGAALQLADAIRDAKERVGFCSVCCNITETDPCRVCTDATRDRSAICVVESPVNMLAIERGGAFRGLYHVLHGALSPLSGVGPEDLRLRELEHRLREGTFREVIVATNPSVEGEATALYIRDLVDRLGADIAIDVTRIAHGVPIGSDLEFTDDRTLAMALEGRRPF